MLEDSNPGLYGVRCASHPKGLQGAALPGQPVSGYRYIGRDIRALSRAKMAAAEVDATTIDGGVVHERYGAWSS